MVKNSYNSETLDILFARSWAFFLFILSSIAVWIEVILSKISFRFSARGLSLS